MITSIDNISIIDIGYIENTTLNILYPQDYTEFDIFNMINKLISIFQKEENTITDIIIKNTEISVRLFLFIIELINKNKIVLWLPETVHEQFKIKKDSINNLTKLNIELIKVYIDE